MCEINLGHVTGLHWFECKVSLGGARRGTMKLSREGMRLPRAAEHVFRQTTDLGGDGGIACLGRRAGDR